MQVRVGQGARMQFSASLLQLRGRSQVQPLHRQPDGSMLLFNGASLPSRFKCHIESDRDTADVKQAISNNPCQFGKIGL